MIFLARIISQEKINFIIKNFNKFSYLVESTIKVDTIKEDADDNRILECAETANVDYIISGDKHLKKLKYHKNIRIVSPKEFLEIYLKHIKIK